MKTGFEELVRRMVENDMYRVEVERAEELLPINQIELLEKRDYSLIHYKID